MRMKKRIPQIKEDKSNSEKKLQVMKKDAPRSSLKLLTGSSN